MGIAGQSAATACQLQRHRRGLRTSGLQVAFRLSGGAKELGGHLPVLRGDTNGDVRLADGLRDTLPLFDIQPALDDHGAAYYQVVSQSRADEIYPQVVVPQREFDSTPRPHSSGVR